MSRAEGGRQLGMTVLGDFVVSEGPQRVVENLARAGVTAISCNPTVTAAASEAGRFISASRRRWTQSPPVRSAALRQARFMGSQRAQLSTA